MPRNFPFASSKIHKKSIESEFRNSKLLALDASPGQAQVDAVMEKYGLQYDSGVAEISVGEKQYRMMTARDDFGTLVSFE